MSDNSPSNPFPNVSPHVQEVLREHAHARGYEKINETLERLNMDNATQPIRTQGAGIRSEDIAPPKPDHPEQPLFMSEPKFMSEPNSSPVVGATEKPPAKSLTPDEVHTHEEYKKYQEQVNRHIARLGNHIANTAKAATFAEQAEARREAGRVSHDVGTPG